MTCVAPARADPRPHLLHVPGQDALHAILGAQEQRPVDVDVLGHAPQLAALGLHQHLEPERRGERAPAGADRPEALVLVDHSHCSSELHQPGDEHRAVDPARRDAACSAGRQLGERPAGKSERPGVQVHADAEHHEVHPVRFGRQLGQDARDLPPPTWMSLGHLMLASTPSARERLGDGDRGEQGELGGALGRQLRAEHQRRRRGSSPAARPSSGRAAPGRRSGSRRPSARRGSAPSPARRNATSLVLADASRRRAPSARGPWVSSSGRISSAVSRSGTRTRRYPREGHGLDAVAPVAERVDTFQTAVRDSPSFPESASPEAKSDPDSRSISSTSWACVASWRSVGTHGLPERMRIRTIPGPRVSGRGSTWKAVSTSSAVGTPSAAPPPARSGPGRCPPRRRR